MIHRCFMTWVEGWIKSKGCRAALPCHLLDCWNHWPDGCLTIMICWGCGDCGDCGDCGSYLSTKRENAFSGSLILYRATDHGNHGSPFCVYSRSCIVHGGNGKSRQQPNYNSFIGNCRKGKMLFIRCQIGKAYPAQKPPNSALRAALRSLLPHRLCLIFKFLITGFIEFSFLRHRLCW